jgi:hypothetical protein
MRPLEHNKLLTKCQILEQETVMRAKEANQRSEAESKGTKHAGRLYQNTGGDESSYVIDSKVGRSFGEAQPITLCCKLIRNLTNEKQTLLSH